MDLENERDRRESVARAYALLIQWGRERLARQADQEFENESEGLDPK
jgi:hypothetical protein